MMKANLIAVLIALCTFNNVAYAEDAPAEVDYIYQVKQGDNLGKLSRDVLDSPARWNEVARYNKLKNSNLIVPGQTLRIQLAWLKNVPAEARIESLTGAVTLNGQPAKVGDVVPTGAALETSAGGSVRLSLPDGSTMNVLEKSNLAAKQLQKKERGNFFYAIFRLVTGRVEVFKKKYPAGQAPLYIQSKNATIGVRGTHFRMGQEGDNTLAEIEEGLVAFDAEKMSQHLEVAGGQGSVADGIHPSKVIPLLPQPTFPAFPADFPPTAVSFTMLELSGAMGYSGEISQDADFAQIIASVNAQGNTINISGLSEGRYWVRLRAVDESGLQGMEEKTSFSVKIPPPPPPPPVIVEPIPLPTVVLDQPLFERGKQLTASWRGDANFKYELQLAGSEDFKLPLITRSAQGNQLSVPTPMAGHYFMRVRAVDHERVGEWSNSVDLIVK